MPTPTIPQRKFLGVFDQAHLTGMVEALDARPGYRVERDEDAGTIQVWAKLKGTRKKIRIFSALLKTDAAPGTWIVTSLPGLLSRA